MALTKESESLSAPALSCRGVPLEGLALTELLAIGWALPVVVLVTTGGALDCTMTKLDSSSSSSTTVDFLLGSLMHFG